LNGFNLLKRPPWSRNRRRVTPIGFLRRSSDRWRTGTPQSRLLCPSDALSFS